jgi:glycosyltransferase involved in cell wall biosynthesis
MEKVTLYVPCFNASKYLKPCVESVLRQTYPVDEILIIDDGSTDDTAAIAGQLPVKLVRHGRQRGLGAARNTAFRESRNEFVAALDADCVADPQWLELLMKGFNRDAIAGAGGRLHERYTARLADQWRSSHMPQHWGEIELIDPPFLFGCNTVFKKSILMAAGSYDERFTTNYEDVNISGKILKKDFHLFYCPAAVVGHLKTDTVPGVLKTFWQWHYYGHIDIDRADRAAGRFFAHMRFAAGITRRCVSKDVVNKRYGMLGVDLISIFYLMWFSIRDCFKTKAAQ